MRPTDYHFVSYFINPDLFWPGQGRAHTFDDRQSAENLLKVHPLNVAQAVKFNQIFDIRERKKEKEKKKKGKWQSNKKKL